MRIKGGSFINKNVGEIFDGQYQWPRPSGEPQAKWWKQLPNEIDIFMSCIAFLFRKRMSYTLGIYECISL